MYKIKRIMHIVLILNYIYIRYVYIYRIWCVLKVSSKRFRSVILSDIHIFFSLSYIYIYNIFYGKNILSCRLLVTLKKPCKFIYYVTTQHIPNMYNVIKIYIIYEHTHYSSCTYIYNTTHKTHLFLYANGKLSNKININIHKKIYSNFFFILTYVIHNNRFLSYVECV